MPCLVGMEENSGRSASFRQKLVLQIEDAMRTAGVVHNQTSEDIENDLFMKAKFQEEYLTLVARLAIHFHDVYAKNMQRKVTNGPSAGAVLRATDEPS